MRRWWIEFGWRRRRNDKDNADRVGMAGGECNHLRQYAGEFDTKRWLGVSIRHLLLDDADDGTRCGIGQRGCDLHTFRYHRLQRGDGRGERDSEQGDTDGVGMADGERDQLRADAVELDADGRHGVGGRYVCLDELVDGAQRGNCKRRRDFHADGYNGLQHGGGRGKRGGERGDADGDGVADGERDHLWADAVELDFDGRHSVGAWCVCLDDVDD